MIIGHKKQQQFFNKMIVSGKISHALLLSGPEKLGKKTLAFNLIFSIFGENFSQHPDFIFIEPKNKYPKAEKGSVGNNAAPHSSLAKEQIPIEQIRNLQWRLSLKPIKAPLLGVIIDQAHLMNKQAQNCFLKTLEEPKTKAFLILITEHPNFLLPTIISRCERVKFYPVKKDEIKNYLERKGVSKDKIEEIIEISLGRPGVAIDLFQNPQKLEERKKKIKELIKILNSPLSFRFQYAKELSGLTNKKEILGIWMSYFRKLLISNENQISRIKTINILNLIQQTIFRISTTNVNPRLALEVLMLEF